VPWAINYLKLPLRQRKALHKLWRQQVIASGEQPISFAQLERLARTAARIRQGPSGNIQL